MDNINKSNVYSYTPGLSGCGCGSRRYYTKAEIDAMLANVLDEDNIKEILDQMFEEYIEEGDLEQLILNIIGDVYTKEQVDAILANYATRGWVREYTDANYLKDITLTINGEVVHNNGDIIIEGGGTGGTIDISGKLDTTAFTQAMQNETARTESTYAKKSEIPSLSDYATKTWVQSQGYLTQHQDISGKVDKTEFNSFTAETNQCCEYVRGELEDIWAAIAALTGDTPTPPVPGTSTGSTIYITYNVTSTTTPTRIMNQSEVDSNKSRVYLTDGYEIIKSTGYTFEELGLNSLIYIVDPETTIPVNPNVLYQDNLALNAWSGIDSIVDVTIVGDTRLFYGERVLNDCVNLTGITVANDCQLWRLSGPSGCTSLSNVSIPASTPMAQFGGFDYCPLITNISIPDSVQVMVYATLNGSGLSTIVLPSNLTNIGGNTFNNISTIESITINATTPPSLGSNTTSLGEISKSFPIYVPAESVTEYKRNSYYQNYAYRIEAIPNE